MVPIRLADWFGVDFTRLEGVSMITFKINDKEVVAEEGQTILEVAREHKIEIPTLCYHQALSPAGACRLCTVEVYDGRRTRLVTSCNYPVWRGMEVQTDSGAGPPGETNDC